MLLFYLILFCSLLSALHTQTVHISPKYIFVCTSHFLRHSYNLCVCSFLCSACCKFDKMIWLPKFIFPLANDCFLVNVNRSLPRHHSLALALSPSLSLSRSLSPSHHHQTIFHICCVCYSISQHQKNWFSCVDFSFFFSPINLQAKLLFVIVCLTSSKTKLKWMKPKKKNTTIFSRWYFIQFNFLLAWNFKLRTCICFKSIRKISFSSSFRLPLSSTFLDAKIHKRFFLHINEIPTKNMRH